MQAIELFKQNEVLERMFEVKRQNFIAEHGLVDKPAIILQVFPETETSLSVESNELHNAIRLGSGQDVEFGWWDGFQTNSVSLNFDGIVSTRNSQETSWATEVHTDGTILGGVWTFPNLQDNSGNNSPAIGDFYSAAFGHFAQFAFSVMQVSKASEQVYFTASLIGADQLPMMNGLGRKVAGERKRSVYRWPNIRLNVADLPKVGKDMGLRLRRLYGLR